MVQVLLATCADLPDGDEDARTLLSALDGLGVNAHSQVWTDPHAQWDASLVVLRSTWDYTGDRDLYVDWVAGLEREQPVRDRFGADEPYARVDLLPSPHGPVVVELTEPSLFLGYGADHPVEAFAAAIAAHG